MRIAALYDIHGNLPALESVLDEVSRAEVDEVIIGGDVVPGPMVKECLAALHALGLPVSFILGNSEVAVLAEWSGAPQEAMPQSAREVVRWTARHLSAATLDVFATWPKSLRLRLEGLGDVLFCHGTPRHENEIFTRNTPEPALLPVFAGIGADVVVCGHTHMQFERRVGNVRVVNAGSVGMPFGDPGADWLLLENEVVLRHTTYDLEAAAVRISATSYPDAAAFARDHVLAPPSEEAMLALFARAELRYGK